MKFIALISITTFSLVAVALIMGANPYAFSKKAKVQVEKKLDKISDVVGSATAKPDFSNLKQCEYFRVDTKPFLCARGELILVKADKADRYCTRGGFSQNLDGKTYCQFNGVDSRLKISNATPF